MTSNLRFYRQRLRHASLPEILRRMRQGLAWYHLRLEKKFFGWWLKTPDIASEDIKKLRMPELIPKENNGAL